MKMTFEEVKQKLEVQKYISITKIDDMEHGKSIKLSNGGIVNCYNTGKIAIQGKNSDVISQILSNHISPNKKIFVVYGHDDIAKTQLEALLRRWDLEPVILDQEASCGQTIIEKLESCISDVGYAIVLATPDDEGKAKGDTQFKKRVRQNVVLELGMFLAKLGRDKVAILLKQDVEFEKPSDIHGLIYIPFQTRVDEAALSLVKELARQGYHIDNKNL